MEAAAAAAVDGRGDEATRPAGGQPAEATEQPASPNAVEQAAAAEHKPGGAVTAAAARAGARAQGTSSGGSAPKRKPGRPALHQGCQVCGTPLEGMRSFHQRYHICEKHMMSDCVEWKGEPQRFCQQCGRFHPLDAFAPGMRSCRKQLAKHAERRRRGRELAAQAAAAAAAAAGGGKPGASTAAPAAKRPRSVALNAPEPATVGAARLLQPPSTWRISDSTGSGGSSGLHQSVPESGVDALLAAAEEDALAEAEGMDEDTGLLKQEPQQDAPPLRLEPDPAWFAGAATVPLPPPPLPAAATLGGLGPALPGAGAADAAMAAALAALGGGPAALAVAAAQQAQQAQLLTLLLAQQQQQRQRQSALAALLSTGLPVQPDSTALALALMQQSGQAAAVPPQATLLQQLLGGGAGGGAAALLQQAVAQQQVQQQVPPLLDDRQSIRERHVAVLYRAAVERLMQTVLQVAPQALALPGALAQLQAQPLTQNAQQPEPQQPTGQPAQQQQQQQQQSAPPVQQQQQQQQQEQQQRPAAASPVPHVIVVTPVPAQPLSPPQQGQPASQPVSPLAQHPQ